jgi:integrase
VRPLGKAAQALLAMQPHIDGGPLVFTTTGRHPLSASKPKKAFDAACGVTDWTLHDCRRTHRTLASRAGVAADIGERCMGHVIGGVRAVYDKHKYLSEMQTAFEAVAAQLERIVSPPAGDVVTPLRKHVRAGKPARIGNRV